MKITEYENIEKFTTDNILLTDGNNGTKKISVKNALFSSLHITSPKLHSMVYRGDYLGTSLTSTQRANIQNGSFDDLWLGDYWVISDVTWRIVDFDYWYNVGDTAFTSHHLVIMPDKVLYNAAMHSKIKTVSGYVGSDMYKTNLATAKTTISNAFGGAVLTHRLDLSNAWSNDMPSGVAWYDSTVDLPNEVMMYGNHQISMGVAANKIAILHDSCKTQLALFRVCPAFIVSSDRTMYWLRDQTDMASFACIFAYGNTYTTTVINSEGVRPAFAIG